MITIDQLLESVDLDFEPRWVTKDKDGLVSVWEQKPEQIKNLWYAGCKNGLYSHLKLAEFDGKGWTECIYEVPRKTTGKIEKLETELMQYTFDEKEYETLKMPSLENFMNKVNELVDAVNELKERTEPKKLTGFAKTLFDCQNPCQ